MDLGAFLEPGFYPVFLLNDSEKKEPWGYVLKRSDKPLSWVSSKPLSANSIVTLALDVPGFGIGPEGELYPDQSLVAALIINGTVRACRYLQSRQVHVLRFVNLIRLVD
jgi:hypothetical protein